MKTFKENLYGGLLAQEFAIEKVLYEGKSRYQQIVVFTNKMVGTALALDGVIQTTTKDEFVYHEMLTHLPVNILHNVENVLVIGAGDGGIIEELFKYDFIKKVVMVELDEEVIRLSKRYLRPICKNAFKDKRLTLVIDDGMSYVKKTNERFDLVIVDSPDPIGPGKVLFSKKFYTAVYNILSENGIMVRQTGSSFYQPAEMKSNYRILKGIFPFVAPYVAAIPTYIGGFFTFLLASKKANCDLSYKGNTSEVVMDGLKYYCKDIHNACFILPRHIQV